MKRFAFVSDFDGTLTSRDFYHIIIDKYLKDWGRDLYTQWKKTKKINVEFLNKIFGSMNLSLSDLHEEILKIPIDPSAKGFIERVKSNQGDFYIVSAGTSYYIEILLKHLAIQAEVISMKGVYQNNGILIIPDKNSPYHSDIFGIDKKKVLEDIKKRVDVVFFAGDSEPDLQAAKAADFAFARGELKSLLDEEHAPNIPYGDFSEIEAYLKGNGWLNESTNS